MTNFQFRGPSDDWDPQGYSDEDKVADDLAALGMHDTSDEEEAKKKKDELELEEEAAADHVIEPVAEVEEEEELDVMTELERQARKVRDDEMTLGEVEE